MCQWQCQIGGCGRLMVSISFIDKLWFVPLTCKFQSSTTELIKSVYLNRITETGFDRERRVGWKLRLEMIYHLLLVEYHTGLQDIGE